MSFFIVLLLRTVNGAGSAFSSGTVEKSEVLASFGATSKSRVHGRGTHLFRSLVLRALLLTSYRDVL